MTWSTEEIASACGLAMTWSTEEIASACGLAMTWSTEEIAFPASGGIAMTE